MNIDINSQSEVTKIYKTIRIYLKKHDGIITSNECKGIKHTENEGKEYILDNYINLIFQSNYIRKIQNFKFHKERKSELQCESQRALICRVEPCRSI